MNNPPAFPNDAVKDPFDKAGMTWPFPTHPLKPWTKKQEEQYQQQQRNKLPEAPL